MITNYTMIPDHILDDKDISSNAKIIWCKFRQKATIKGWIHHTSYIAEQLGLTLKTVQTAVKSLIKKGYLTRKPKGNVYDYSIPEQYLCLKKEVSEKMTVNFTTHNKKEVSEKMTVNFTTHNKKELSEKMTVNFTTHNKKELSEKMTVKKMTVKKTTVNFTTHNKKDINNTDQNNIECDQEKKETNKNTNTHTHTQLSNSVLIQNSQKDSQEVINHPTKEHPPVINSFSQQKPTKPILKQERQTKTPLPQRVVSLKDSCNNLVASEWIDPATGDYKEGFMAWACKWAMTQFKDLTDINRAKWFIRRYFKNDSTRIVDLWEAYKAEFNQRAENAQAVMSNGITLTEEEKEQLGKMYVETHSTPQKSEISPLLPSNDEIPIEQQTSPNLPQKTAQDEKIPVNPKVKFLYTLQILYTKSGGKAKLGDFKNWSNSPENKAKFIQYLKNNNLVEQQLIYEKFNNVPSVFD